jgi:hypothetical protein
VVTSIHLGFFLASFLYDYQGVDGGIKTLVSEEDRIGFGDVISHAHVESTTYACQTIHVLNEWGR